MRVGLQTAAVHSGVRSALAMPMVRVLHIDDDAIDANIFARLLNASQPGFYAISHVENLASARLALREEYFDLVLLDVNLRESHGTTSIEYIQKCNAEVPIVCISGCSDESTAFEMVEAGAQDFISKNEMSTDQVARIVRFSMYRKQTEERLRSEAQRDLLTGLPNRRLLEDRLDHAIHRAVRGNTGVAMLFLDLDRFKAVNDTFGHSVGDALLSAVAQRLQQCVRESDTIARIGGDEFTVLLEDIQDDADVKIVAEKIIHTVSQPFVVGATELTTSTSIGISMYPESGEVPDTLLENADAAMYQAKSNGRNNYCFFSGDLLHIDPPVQGELFH